LGKFDGTFAVKLFYCSSGILKKIARPGARNYDFLDLKIHAFYLVSVLSGIPEEQ